MIKIIKILFFIFFITFFIKNAGAQSSPSGMLFQAIARDANNVAASNRNIFIIVNILEGNPNGSNAYKESFQVLSTNEGIFSITIGQGMRLSGATSLINLDWANRTYYLNINIAIQPTLPDVSWKPDNYYLDLGTTQFWSVPYAFASNNSKISESANTISSILPGSKGGTGVNNNGKTITLSNNIVTIGTGDLTVTTTASSSITFPTSGLLANTNFVKDQIGKDTVSLSNRINQKLDDSQFPILITPYLKTISGMKYSDTSQMLSNRFAKDTISLSNRIDSKFSITDTIYLQQKIDTALMLATYARKFTKNVTLNIADGKSLGKYQNGAIIPAAGKTLDEFLADISTESIHPNYIAPSVSMSNPTGGVVEIGFNPGTLTLSNIYIQNNAGVDISKTFFKNNTSLGSAVTDSPGPILSNLTYKVTVNYGHGPILNDNLGSPDPVGRILAGSITSGNITYTPKSKKYWGSSTNQAISFTPLPNTSEYYDSPSKGTFSINLSGSQYVFYAYPAIGADLTSISVGGFESINSFTKSILDITNAQGYTQSYKLYVSNNNFSSNVTNIIIQ